MSTLFWSFVNEREGRSLDSAVFSWLFIQEVVIHHHAIIHPCRRAILNYSVFLSHAENFPSLNSVAVAVQIHNCDRVPCQSSRISARLCRLIFRQELVNNPIGCYLWAKEMFQVTCYIIHVDFFMRYQIVSFRKKSYFSFEGANFWCAALLFSLWM